MLKYLIPDKVLCDIKSAAKNSVWAEGMPKKREFTDNQCIVLFKGHCDLPNRNIEVATNSF